RPQPLGPHDVVALALTRVVVLPPVRGLLALLLRRERHPHPHRPRLPVRLLARPRARPQVRADLGERGRLIEGEEDRAVAPPILDLAVVGPEDHRVLAARPLGLERPLEALLQALALQAGQP